MIGKDYEIKAEDRKHDPFTQNKVNELRPTFYMVWVDKSHFPLRSNSFSKAYALFYIIRILCLFPSMIVLKFFFLYDSHI